MIVCYGIVHIIFQCPWNKTLPVREPLSCSPAAETALQPLIWCSESLYSKGSSFSGGVFLLQTPVAHAVYCGLTHSSMCSDMGLKTLKLNFCGSKLWELTADVENPDSYFTFWWHYLSNATCLIRPHLLYSIMRCLLCPGSSYFATWFIISEENMS